MKNIKLSLKSTCIISILQLSSLCQASVYTDTIKQIDNIYSKSNTHTHEEFCNLDIIKDNSKFKKLLKELSENKEGELSKVKGYYHPVGFIKVVIYKGEKGQQMRLHFWGKGGEKAIEQEFNGGWEPIHNHRWNFSSKVIKGGLMMKEYTDFDDARRFNDITSAKKALAGLNKTFKMYDVSLVPTNNIDYKVIDTGQFALVGNCIDKYVSSNQSYWISNTTPHQVQPKKNTSTLLLMDPATKLFASEIFPTKEDKFENNMNLQNITQKEIQSYIKEFLEAINKEEV